MNKNKIIKLNWILVLIGLLLLLGLFFRLYLDITKDASDNTINSPGLTNFSNALVAPLVPSYPYKTTIREVTAYSSTIDQCGSDPFTTASETTVRDGVVASNFLKFGTKIRFPEIYGNKIFVVEDRMVDDTMIDIWFPDRQLALNFGRKILEVQILIN